MLYKLLFLGNRIQGIGEGAVTIAGGINGLSKLGKAFFAFLLSISLFTNTRCLRKTSPHFLPLFFFFLMNHSTISTPRKCQFFFTLRLAFSKLLLMCCCSSEENCWDLGSLVNTYSLNAKGKKVSLT